MIKKNNELKLNIVSLGVNGEGVAKHNGAVIFVPHALPGEIVNAKIIYAKSNFYVAKVINIIEENPHRTNPPCPHFFKCGGCNLQHLNYEEQLKHKTELVSSNLLKIAGVNIEVNKTIKSNRTFNYRNKFSFPIGMVNGVPCVGMFKAQTHEIIAINNCLIQQEWARDVIEIFNHFLLNSNNSVFNEQTKKGLVKHLVCRSEENQLLVCVVINGNTLNNSQLLIDLLSKKFKNFGLMININKLHNNVILSNNYKHLFGINNIITTNNGIESEISINSFMQVNSYIAQLIYEQVTSEASGNTVVNAYSGAGLLSAMLSRTAKHVYGIEIVESAHENAQKLMERNKISNVTNICGDVAVELRKISNFDTIVLDPPRKGCDKIVVDTINNVAPQKIIYVSCDSATLARDIKNLTNYSIKYVQPFDMFPQTKHVETLVVLNKI